METIVIALGGNALLSPSGKQSFYKEYENMSRISKVIANLSRRYNLIITHGNGSQVGDEVMRNEHAKEFVPKLPLYLLNAETQAQVGSVVETSIRRSLNVLDIKKDTSVILAHVLVDKNDSAFKNPSKPIGPFYAKKELTDELKFERFNYIKFDNKYRRVVASPKPKEILEIDSINRESKNSIIITCGGGGIPVIKDKDSIKGINAVIDKDLTSQLLANSVGAKKLLILTNAEYLYSDYKNMKNPIKEIPASVLKKSLEKFEIGTIKPKLEACIKFIENGGRGAFIGNIFKIDKILDGNSGTKIV